jgi:hypothetical protein
MRVLKIKEKTDMRKLIAAVAMAAFLASASATLAAEKVEGAQKKVLHAKATETKPTEKMMEKKMDKKAGAAESMPKKMKTTETKKKDDTMMKEKKGSSGY